MFKDCLLIPALGIGVGKHLFLHNLLYHV